jgi:integrase
MSAHVPRTAKGLTAAKVAKAGPGRYGDGAGLYLVVRGPTQRFWVFRYVRNGRMREMGLGGAAGRTGVSLVEAREKAHDLYKIHRAGRDPLAEKAAAKAFQLVAAGKAVTFKAEAERYIAAQEAGWRNAKHAAQWSSTLETYAYPVIGPLPVSAIDVGLVLKCLEPIWSSKPETASRVRGRIEAVLDASRARGNREGENPAMWKGNLDHLLPARGKVKKPEHHAALPFARIGSFMAALRKQEGTAARALEFAILTAARTGEVIGATWAEINLRGKVWIVPAGRMKGGREHRVPLCPRALEIIGEAYDGYVFSGGRPDQPLSNMALLMLLRRMKHSDVTVHGFRSAFRDWAAERTNYPSEVAEMALAHAVGDKVEAAYRRGDLFEKRRALADAWAKYCSAPPVGGGVVTPLRRAR